MNMAGFGPGVIADWFAPSWQAAAAGMRDGTAATRTSRRACGPPYRNPARARFTALHESGHALAIWKLFGADCLTAIEVYSNGDLDGSLGATHYHELSGATPHERGLIIAAGPAAARILSLCHGPQTFAWARCDSDREQFLDLGLSEGEWLHYLDVARDLFRLHAEGLQAVADRVYQTGYVDGTDFDRLMRGC
jgi:hypothetical protein